MRAVPLLTFVAIMCGSPAIASAQQKGIVKGVLTEMDVDSPQIAAQRFADQVHDRLQPIEQRFRDDDRLRRAGAVAGAGAIVLGAVGGQAPLTFVGTHALRLALDRPLTAIRRRSGFVVEPSIGHRAIAITANRSF
jgi:hypothetical protein